MKFVRPAEDDPVSAEQYILVLDELERVSKWSVAAPLELRDTAAGFALTINTPALDLPIPQYPGELLQGLIGNKIGFGWFTGQPTP
jgi:hypothetical protein